ncbi:unnamed protein product [Protopolystoma xenopodis]|uniref:MAM domain-containing protein n=1 Tax=Protopolystoma xenopodis TaxID=117903 RepID=A0A448WHH9_9PLAT|nr:unnamed protein product [Protopolystoma xenopodis]
MILEGTIPAGYPDARICVDNITSYTEPCSALEPVVAKREFNFTRYFIFISLGALLLGLTVPILFLLVLICICRRRHKLSNSAYANGKLFSTNLWYYIGGKEIAEEPASMRTANTLPRSEIPSSGFHRYGNHFPAPHLMLI